MDRKPVIYWGAVLAGISNLPNPLALALNTQNVESIPKPTGDIKVPTAKEIFLFLEIYSSHMFAMQQTKFN